MVNLTFGEQVKIILSRKGMTIKRLAEEVEKHTGKPMSRQNMTQRLNRDNFQEQDMRLIAEILGCQFTLSIMEPAEVLVEDIAIDDTMPEAPEVTEDLVVDADTVVNIETVDKAEAEEVQEIVSSEVKVDSESEVEKEILRKGVVGFFKKSTPTAEMIGRVEEVKSAETQTLGEINPYTRKEYETNSVRMHPKKIGYIQVYDRETHQWADMTEWAFLGYQERLKKLLGKDYKEPIYLD